MQKRKLWFRRACGLFAVLLLLTFHTSLILPSEVEAASETWVSGTEDQYPSPKHFGAYWYDAVKPVDEKNWKKTRVVEDRTLPPRAFFIPSPDLDTALRPWIEWRKQPFWQSLNGDWKFKLVPKPADVLVDFYQEQYDASSWGTMQVPGNWQLLPNEIGDEPMYSNWYYPWGQKNWTIFGEPNIPGETVNYSLAFLMTAPKNYNPVGHYIREFSIPSEQKEKQIILNFQGVQSAAYVYVNGRYVGYCEDSFAQHEFDITSFVHREGPNRLAVLVYRWSDGSLLENQDMVNYSGITRDVGILYRDREAHLLDYSNTVTLSQDHTQATVQTRVQLSEKAQARISLYEGKKPVATSDWVQSGQEASLTVQNPKLWSTEAPHLYHQVVEVRGSTGKSTEFIGSEIGLRQISLLELSDGKTTYALNGHRIVFKGVNRHELNNNHGHVMSLETLHKDFQLMRQHNVNAIRTCHYPNVVDFYMLCNQYGLMVCDEANLETHAAGGTAGIPMAVETFRYPALHRGMNLYERDKNFSCVVTWSTGNECIFFPPPKVDEHYSFRLMYLYIHERDSQRPVVLERDPREGITDIRSRMYWAASEHDNFNFLEPIETNDKKILEAPDKRPYFQVEYAHSMGNSLGYYKEYWDLWRQYEHSMGGFIWDWVDQSPLWPIPEGKTATGMSYQADGTKVPYGGTHYYAYGGDWAKDKNNNFNNFMDNGLISSDRIPHDSHQQLKYVQQDILFSNFDRNNQTLSVKNEFSFTDLQAYDFVVTSFRDGHELAKVSWTISQEPETTQTHSLASLWNQLKLPAALEKQTDAQYYLRVSAHLKADQGEWGHAGDEIAMEEFQLNSVDPNSNPVPIQTRNQNKIEQNADQVRVYNDRFSFVLDKWLGQWTQFTVNGKEFFAQLQDPEYGPVFQKTDGKPMQPGMYANFWRAPVDNDREGNFLQRVKEWREANWWKKRVDVQVATPSPYQTIVDVVSHYQNLSVVQERYTIYSDGHIQYRQELDPTRRMDVIPSVGTIFELKGEFNQMEYFGRGPATTFVDRWEGYPHGIYQETVNEKALGNYVKPQENANHVGVHWARIQNTQGQGLFVKSATQNETLEVMASPYNQYDVTDHAHPYELTWTPRVFFRVAFRNQGVGGENSWGARALPYAEIRPEKQTHTFDIFPIETASTEVPSAPLTVNRSEGSNSQPSSLMERAYPLDPDSLYRTTRVDLQWLLKVQIQTEKDSLKEYDEFQPTVKFYRIPVSAETQFEDLAVKPVFQDGEERPYRVERQIGENQATLLLLLYEKGADPQTAQPLVTYTFVFQKPDSEPDPDPTPDPAPDPQPNPDPGKPPFQPDQPDPQKELLPPVSLAGFNAKGSETTKVTGRAQAHVVVEIRDESGKPLATVLTDGEGNFKIDVPHLPDGTHLFAVTKGPDGKESSTIEGVVSGEDPGTPSLPVDSSKPHPSLEPTDSHKPTDPFQPSAQDEGNQSGTDLGGLIQPLVPKSETKPVSSVASVSRSSVVRTGEEGRIWFSTGGFVCIFVSALLCGGQIRKRRRK